MYIEFVIGYIIMGVLAALLAAVIVLLCILLKKVSRMGVRPQEHMQSPYSKNSGRGTVICRNCATQYESIHTVCPKCRTQRYPM